MRRLGLDVLEDMSGVEKSIYLAQQSQQNYMCFRGHSFSWGNNGYDKVNVNCGHWGPSVYAGCGAVRSGEAKYLKPQNYQQTY